MSQSKTIFHQLFEPESCTYTYIVGDAQTKEVAIIDPVLETVERDLKFIQELGLKLIYVLDTHIHADHITGAGQIRKLTGAKTAVSAKAKVDCTDISLEDGQELKIGSHTLKALATPGHTDGCMSYYFDGRVFTGDALLIRGCGRTDFQQGSSERLYQSVTKKIFSLPGTTEVCPGHDYKGFNRSTVSDEKALNPRLGGGVTQEQFIQTMSELKLAHPKKIHEALPANMACGLLKEKKAFQYQVNNGVNEVSVQQTFDLKDQVNLVDVRTPAEFNNELGHIKGAQLVELGPDLMRFLQTADKSQEIIFVCRSGARSGQATAMAQQMGFEFVANMVGGMIEWNDSDLPVVRD